jgi:hypothetical protein
MSSVQVPVLLPSTDKLTTMSSDKLAGRQKSNTVLDSRSAHL